MYLTVPFFVSSLVVIMTPGPDLMLVTRIVMKYKRRRLALAAAAGMISAGVIQLALGLAGVALLLKTDPFLFTVLRCTGAVVLFVWGLLALRSALNGVSAPAETEADPPVRAAGNTYWQGLLCTGSNPKVGLFLMAFLPQFVPKDVKPFPSLLFLGGMYLSMGLAWLVTFINITYQVNRRVLLSSGVMRLAELLLSCVFFYFAVRLAGV
jgi:threonine/homoserine/homoserine lactone efflux protein